MIFLSVHCCSYVVVHDVGRLGNQVEHFLGGMAFAAALERTLVLPPFRTYVCCWTYTVYFCCVNRII